MRAFGAVRAAAHAQLAPGGAVSRRVRSDANRARARNASALVLEAGVRIQ